MTDVINNITDTGKEIAKDIKEVVKERFFSPMYFYFLLSWSVSNWTFLYSLLFVSQSTLGKQKKVDYLLSFYPTDTFWDYACNTWYVLIAPAISTFVILWWFSILSEKSYEKFEEYKANKRTIKRLLDYEEKVKIAKEERKIREAESDKPEINYIDNKDFNEYFDNASDNIVVAGVDYLPSEVLFNTDYEAYKNEYEIYLTEKGL